MTPRNRIWAGVIVVAISVAIVYFLLKPTPITTKMTMCEIILDLTLPENISNDGRSYKIGVAHLALPDACTESPEDLMEEIFVQYRCYLENSAHENERTLYSFWVRALTLDNYLTEHGIPLIRQDNENINFCFYVAHGTYPVGSYSWWDTINGDLTFTLILPEGYDLRTDVLRPVGWFGPAGEKDSEYSIFTSAHTELENEQRLMNLTKEFKDNRWRITAKWEKGKFDKFNTPLYLEVHYRKIQP
jgi:hypothetical protein